MLTVYATENGRLCEKTEIMADTWVQLYAPTDEELAEVSKKLLIDADMLKAALDEEERSRTETEDGNMLVLVDTPMVTAEGGTFVYSTLPFGVIITKTNIVTVCLKDTALTRAFADGAVKDFSVKKRNKMTLQLLYRNATLFLFYLHQVDKASNRIENDLYISMKNKALIQMLGLEKSLVYFSTSLKGNEVVLEKLLRLDFVRDYPEDTELLEDVIIENKQAIEMSNIYRDILSSTTEAFGSLISNNLNDVMKLLAAITIILTVPTIISGIWGMNVGVPFQNSPYGFVVVMGLIVVITVLSVILAVRKKWL
ncbi:MAG: magnesium transporter CorA family protein [Oscillospiraceae bacterium]